jgi:hypothetical protein
MITMLALTILAAGLYSTRRTVWALLEASRRADADIAFMQAMPSRMDGDHAA